MEHITVESNFRAIQIQIGGFLASEIESHWEWKRLAKDFWNAVFRKPHYTINYKLIQRIIHIVMSKSQRKQPDACRLVVQSFFGVEFQAQHYSLLQLIQLYFSFLWIQIKINSCLFPHRRNDSPYRTSYRRQFEQSQQENACILYNEISFCLFRLP